MWEWLTPSLALLGSLLGSVSITIWRFARVESDVERMKQDIGTHDTGMRGAIHKLQNDVSVLNATVHVLEKRLDHD